MRRRAWSRRVIGIARSRDLTSWEEFGTPLIASEGAEWERGGLYKSWLMRDGDRFILFYNAKDSRPSHWQEQTGAAVSDDLVTWTRLTGPLLRNGEEGAIDDRFASRERFTTLRGIREEARRQLSETAWNYLWTGTGDERTADDVFKRVAFAVFLQQHVVADGLNVLGHFVSLSWLRRATVASA